MNKKLSFLLALGFLLVFPVVSFAQPTTLSGAVEIIISAALDIVWKIAAAVVIIMFTVAGIKFLTAQGDPSKLAEARNFVIWGLAGVVVIILAWSIMSLVEGELNL